MDILDPTFGLKDDAVKAVNRGINTIASIPGNAIKGVYNFTRKSVWNVLAGSANIVGGAALRAPIIAVPRF